MLYEYMLELGLNNKEIEIIINKNKLYQYNEEILYKKLKDNYNYLLGLGYSNNEIKNFLFESIFLFTYGVSVIEKKINNLINLGYSMDEIRKMSIKHQAIFWLSIDNINRKRFFLK